MPLFRSGAWVAFLLTPGLVCAQQPVAANVPVAGQSHAAKTAAPKKAKASAAKTQVEIIIGTVTQRQVFDADWPKANAKDNCDPVSIEVINGQAWKTMTFNC